MIVSVTIAFCVAAGEKHWRQMQQAAALLTNLKSSIQISQPSGDPKRLIARFTVPKARQGDIVDPIARKFWNYIEDYANCSISFDSESRRTKRRIGRG
jgi:hypothetical protein